LKFDIIFSTLAINYSQFYDMTRIVGPKKPKDLPQKFGKKIRDYVLSVLIAVAQGSPRLTLFLSKP
jgi:hypothetical protein